MTQSPADPRSSLTGGGRPVDAGQARSPTFVAFQAGNSRTTSDAGSTTWVARSQNLILEYSILKAGDQLGTACRADESVVLSPGESARLEVTWDGSTETLDSRGLVTVPPGRSAVTALATSQVVRLFPAPSYPDAGEAINAADYAVPCRDVAPLEMWPAPPGPNRLRVYRLGGVPRDSARFGNIFRTRAFMVNFLNIDTAPRDPNKLSPHVHGDFEQLSLVAEGEYIHHVRMPWTARSSEWLDDIHRLMGAPSIAIIRPGTVHTSQSVSPGRNSLIDIFSPPRADFSAKPGWVLNSEDYPAPNTARKASADVQTTQGQSTNTGPVTIGQK
jgi:hypothetical protein